MKIPYHGLLVCGDVLVAARGCSLHTFSITDGSHLFTWKSPPLRRDGRSEATPDQENGSSAPASVTREEDTPALAEHDSSSPPTKRRKVERSEKAGEEEPDQEIDQKAAGDGTAKKSRKRGKNKKKQQMFPVPKPEEQPMVQCLTATPDGRYVVAVTGLDKIIWVFEHDGAGNLEQLSQRPMPKRPSSIALTLDNTAILSADKFGDVYLLPLITKDEPSQSSPQSTLSTPATPATPATPQPFKPQANQLTVHTKRNLRALANQKKIQERASAAERGPAMAFEHSLLLGHVSMLTAIVTTVRPDGRPYIVTADRDEHIRVSRGLPLAHVVETFCLGHGEFISRLCVPPGRPEVLLSGGGDDHLFVWDWLAGALLSTAPLLPLVRNVLPGAAQLAVSTLRAFRDLGAGEGAGVWVVAACEAIPALFFFKLEGTNLQHAQTVRLEGNPLDTVVCDTQTGPRLLVALDAAQGTDDEESVNGEPSLVTVGWGGDSGWQPSSFPVGDGMLEDGDANVTREELRKSLYTIEPLRKTDYEEGSSLV